VLDPKEMPKGYETFRMKRDREHAEGDDEIQGTTLFMKKGRDHAEGEEYGGTVAAMKKGRDHAEGSPVPPHSGGYGRPGGGGHGTVLASHASPSGGSGSYHGSGGGHASSGSAGGFPATLSYRVDSSSQLATDSVKFRRGSTELADHHSYRYLLNLSAALKSSELEGMHFVVEGHASAEGSERFNLTLSQRRANAIYDFLVGEGVSPDRLLAVGHGISQARFAAGDPEHLRAQDRQVIVFRLDY